MFVFLCNPNIAKIGNCGCVGPRVLRAGAVVGTAVVRAYGQLLVLGFVSCDHGGMVGHYWTGSGHELDMESSAEGHRLQRFWSVLAPQPSKDVLGHNTVTGVRV